MEVKTSHWHVSIYWILPRCVPRCGQKANTRIRTTNNSDNTHKKYIIFIQTVARISIAVVRKLRKKAQSPYFGYIHYFCLRKHVKGNEDKFLPLCTTGAKSLQGQIFRPVFEVYFVATILFRFQSMTQNLAKDQLSSVVWRSLADTLFVHFPPVGQNLVKNNDLPCFWSLPTVTNEVSESILKSTSAPNECGLFPGR